MPKKASGTNSLTVNLGSIEIRREKLTDSKGSGLAVVQLHVSKIDGSQCQSDSSSRSP